MDPLALKERILKTIELGESQFREFKSAYEGPIDSKVARKVSLVAKDIAEALVGFANADGGELLVGVEDDRRITGHDFTAEGVSRLLQAPKTGVHVDTPLATPIALEIDLENKRILYFSIEKSTTSIHQTSDGRCLQRKDRETRPVAAHTLQFERQEQISREYDRQYVDHVSVTELNLDLIRNVSAATAHMSPEKCLQYLGLADYGLGILRLKRAALLLFANDVTKWHPRSQVRVVRIRGTELKTGREMNIAFDEIETGNILQLLSASWDRLRPHLVETKLSPDSLFREHVMYPEDACREALINAITHRDYSLEGQNIEILIFDDRMEVNSPGSLLSTVTIDSLKKLVGIHESRNALLARVLREVGYVREMGEGMRRIFRLFNDADLVPPELRNSHSRFSIILHYKSVFSAEDQHWLSGYERLRLTREEMLVALLGKNGRVIAPQEIYDLLNLVDWDIYRSLVEQMYTKGILWNTMTEAKKNMLRKRRGAKSNRDVPRLAIRAPEEIDRALSELYIALSKTEKTSFIDKAWIDALSSRLPEKNIYKSGDLQALHLLQILRLVSDEKEPTDLLATLWSAAPQKREVPLEAPAKRSLIETPSKLKAPTDGRTNEPLAIYVGNLPYDVTEQHLFFEFQKIGQVLTVDIPKDFATNRNRGFGFVKMASRDDAARAVEELQGSTIRGRKIRLNWKR